MRLLITVPDLAEESGGPSLSSVRTAEALAGLGVQTAIAFREDARPRRRPAATVSQFPLQTRPGPMGYRHYRSLLDSTVSAFSPDLIYDFGIWLPQNIASARVAANHQLPWVSSPRGMLEPWSRNSKSLKKRLAWWSYQRRLLGAARALVATSEDERTNLRNLLPEASIWLVPNGVDMPSAERLPQKRRRRALFLSRLDAKKQPDLLIRVWSTLRPAGWELTIAGPGDAKYRGYLEQLVREAGPEAQIELRDAAYGADKDALLADSQLFVLPTFSENYGIAVAEALAFGLPVITTTGTPWKDIEARGCGWYVAPTADAFLGALTQACGLPAQRLNEMGVRGRAYIEPESWAGSARTLARHCASI